GGGARAAPGGRPARREGRGPRHCRVRTRPRGALGRLTRGRSPEAPMTNVEKALELVSDGMTLGLGSGRASERFVAALGERVRAGLKVRGVPTSSGTARLAQTAGVPLVPLAEAIPIDVCFDGADEVDPNLDLLKGWGHAL